MRILTMEQRSEAWREARKGHPTASCAARILSSEGKKSKSWKNYQLHLLAERLGIEKEPFEGTNAMHNGVQREGESLALYSFLTGFQVTQVGMIVSDKLSASASPDGLVRMLDSSIVCGLETKNPEGHTYLGEKLSGKIPTKYIPQIHMSMVVSDGEINQWDYMCYVPTQDPIIHHVERNKYTDTFENALKDFCGELEILAKELGI